MANECNMDGQHSWFIQSYFFNGFSAESPDSPSASSSGSSAMSNDICSSTHLNYDQQDYYDTSLNNQYYQNVEASTAEKETEKKANQQKNLPPEIRLRRRVAANARERKRMTNLNAAFERLRKVLPCVRHRPLSKMEALQVAQSYIAELSEVLDK